MRIRFNSSCKQNPRNAMTASASNRQTNAKPPDKPPQPVCEKPPQPKPYQKPIKEEYPVLEKKPKTAPILQLPFCTIYSEDILLLALIMVLINENCDEILLLALIYIFISGLEK